MKDKFKLTLFNKLFLGCLVGLCIWLGVSQCSPMTAKFSTEPIISTFHAQQGDDNHDGIVDRVYLKIDVTIMQGAFHKYEEILKIIDEFTDIRNVTLRIQSGGGSLIDALSLCDLIERFQDEKGFTFRAEASGIVASAAVPIFAVCKERFASKNTMFLVHEGSGNPDVLAFHTDIYTKLLARKSKVTSEKWLELLKPTTIFGVDRAMELGLVDKVY